MGSAETHLGGAGANGKAPRPCETCGEMFTPTRGWGRFCSNRCRNAFHAAEARVEKIRARAVAMYLALQQVVAGRHEDDPAKPCAHCVAVAALKDLKPPIEPKALLTKAKA